ncbi:MAG: acyl-CoA thioesterase [Rhodobacteraceae bacterium]|jgi:4-hydroxybenzoyl-CoA thioesterase|nr:acyl-CoA thioesterase [Paracoccaceae bacterium]
MTSLYHYAHRVSFGDCDPAGIAYYPNIFKWVDTTFHDFLRQFGGHRTLCAEFGATGMGLMEAQARFRSPLQDGDALDVRITALDWGHRSLTLSYQGHVGERLAFEATETRGIFVERDGRLTAAPMAALRARIAADA